MSSYAGMMSILHNGANSLLTEGPSLYGEICRFAIGVVRARNRWRERAKKQAIIMRSMGWRNREMDTSSKARMDFCVSRCADHAEPARTVRSFDPSMSAMASCWLDGRWWAGEQIAGKVLDSDGATVMVCGVEVLPIGLETAPELVDRLREAVRKAAESEPLHTPPPGENPPARYKEEFLQHVVACSSQYDATCRTMAAEILELRKARNRDAVDLSRARRTLKDVWTAAVTGQHPGDVLGQAEKVVAELRAAPGQVRVQWFDDDSGTKIEATIQEFRMTEIVAIDDRGGEVRFDPSDLFNGRLRFIQ